MSSKASKGEVIRWDQCRGRNPIDDVMQLDDDMAAEVLNCDLQENSLPKKRNGCALGIASDSGAPIDSARSMFAGVLSNAGVSAVPTVFTMSGIEYGYAQDNAFVTPVVVGVIWPITVQPGLLQYLNASAAEYNGSLFLSYVCASGFGQVPNRLKLYRPDLGVIYSGLSNPAAPTVANTGAGAYAATLRYYRIQWRYRGSARVVFSNLGTATSFTPSGAGTAARVTRPTAPVTTEPVTHWVVFGSSDGANYYDLSGEIVIGTTTYDDSATVSTYFSGRTAAPQEGAFTPWPTVKVLLNAHERLIGFGAKPAGTGGSAMAAVDGRVYFSPVTGTTDTSDHERISNTTTIKGYIDVSPPVSGRMDRALAGPINDMILVFQDKGVFALIPTGDFTSPYRRVRIDPSKGTIDQRITFVGEDENGQPCVYFWDQIAGPYRYGERGFEWLGYEVQDIASRVPPPDDLQHYNHGQWEPRMKAACFWLSQDTPGTQATVSLRFHAKFGRRAKNSEVRGGWTRHSGDMATAAASCVGFDANYVNASEKYDRILLYIENTDGALALMDRYGKQADDKDGSSFVPIIGAVTSKGFDASMGVVGELGFSYLQAGALASGQIDQTILVDWERISKSGGAVSLTPSGSETTVLRKYSQAQVTNFVMFQIQLHDSSSPSVGPWQLQRYAGFVDTTLAEV